jgi:S-adenosylmethionine decarboxylase
MVGSHLLVDLHGVPPERLNDAALLAVCLETAAARCRMTALAPPVMHCFPGGGVTGFILLAESHIALHTYPERGFMALDVFSCGPVDPVEALAVFREALAPVRERVTCAARGE